MTAAKIKSRPKTTGQLRLSEVISALTYALDITEGQPEGHALRSCMIGMRIARMIGLSDDDQSALYYALLLKDLGCSSNAAKMCWLFKADDRQVKHDVKFIDWTKMVRNGLFALKSSNPGANWFEKIKSVIEMAKKGPDEGRDLIKVRCERGADITRMLGFPEATADAILGLDEHWNGNGHPIGLKGDQIPLLGRICCIAQTAEVFASRHGFRYALQICKRRRGTWFDPELVDAIYATRHDESFWEQIKQDTIEHQVRLVEPMDRVRLVDEDMLGRIALAFSQVVDAKSPWTFRHSEGVAEISHGIAKTMNLPVEKQNEIRLAGLLHDIGKLGVSNLILDKPAKLDEQEYEQMKAHTVYTQKILGRVYCFKAFADYAAAHHERTDGKGYHRQLAGENIPFEARILAVADVTEALAANRPYRAGMPSDRIIDILQGDVGKAFDGACVKALVEFSENTGLFENLKSQAESNQVENF